MLKRKRKKGFTLVELLSIIVILGIIALITVPIISNVMFNVRKNSFKSSVNGLVESSKIYYSGKTKDLDFNGKTFLFGDKKNIEGLTIKGKHPTDGEIIVNANGEIKLYVTDGEFCAFKDFESNNITLTEGIECVKNSETPEISAVSNKSSSDTVSLVANCYYKNGDTIKISKYEFSKDGGKTWDSRLDDNKYSNFYIYSSLKQDEEYEFKARCITDVGTSAETQIEVQPSRIEKTEITVSPSGWAQSKDVTIAYPKGRYKYQYQELNDSDDSIQEDKWITIETTEDGKTHNIFKKTYTENKYIITRILDDTENSYVDSESIAIQKIDRTPPECGSWVENSTWTNKNVTIKLNCDEVQDETNNISGCNQSVYDVKTFNATTKTTNLSYVIEDAAGNKTTCKKDLINVYVDKDKPTCKWSGESTSWRNSGTIKVECIDTGGSECDSSATVKSWAYTSGDTTTLTEALSYTIKDTAGNSTECSKTANVYVDRTPPTCDWTGQSKTWTNADRTITVTCNKGTGSACNSSYNTKSWSYTSGTTKTAALSYTIKDAVGNSTECSKTANVYVDKDAPTCDWTGQSTSWTKSDRTITVTCNKGTGSACNSSYSTKSWSYTSGTTKTAALSYTIKDAAGNSKECSKTAQVYVDKDAPTFVRWDGTSTTWTNADRTINIVYKDSGSGPTSETSAAAATINYNAKTAYVSKQVCDNVGNCVTYSDNVNAYVAKSFSISYKVEYVNEALTAINGSTTSSNGVLAGPGNSQALHSIKITKNDSYIDGDIQISVHAQTDGWLDYVSANTTASAAGRKRLEGAKIKLTGDLAKVFDVYYYVHLQSAGDRGWARNDEVAGSQALCLRMEKIAIKLVPKNQTISSYGSLAPTVTDSAYNKCSSSSTTCNNTCEREVVAGYNTCYEKYIGGSTSCAGTRVDPSYCGNSTGSTCCGVDPYSCPYYKKETYTCC